MRQAKAILRQHGIQNTEITRFKGFYYVLHICRNDMPVPLFFSKNIEDIIEYCKML